MSEVAESVSMPPPVMDEPRPSRAGLWNAGLFALGYTPLLIVFFINLWARPHYQFFPLALGGALLLAWARSSDVQRPLESGRRRVWGTLLMLSFFLLAAAAVLWSPWLGSLAAIIGLAGLIWAAGGRQFFKAMLPALVLAVAIIPPPLSLDTRFGEELRLRAVNWSSQMLDLLGVTHSRSGNIIELPNQQLLVEEACSGINSVLVTMACCLFYMLWRRRSLIHIVGCLLATVSFVLLGNVVRITLGAWLKFSHGIEILSGWPHQVVGIILFVSYLLLILSLDKWLEFLSSP